MKRKEMINILSSGLKAAYGDTIQDRHIVADELLMIIEKAGMLPPAKYEGSSYLYSDKMYRGCKWEPEDEA